MPKKNNEQYEIQQFTPQVRPPLVPFLGDETRELENIRRQTEEMIAREIGTTQAIAFAQRCREYLYEVGLEEVLAAGRYSQRIAEEAKGSMFEKEVCEFIYHGLKLLQRDELALQDAGAGRLYQEATRPYILAKPPWYKRLEMK